jgi:hypothetical protein
MKFSDFVYRASDLSDDITDRHLMSQYLYLSEYSGNMIECDIYKFENIQEDFEYIFNEILGVNDVKLPHLLESNRMHWEGYYTPELKQVVSTRYNKDFTLFGYNDM